MLAVVVTAGGIPAGGGGGGGECCRPGTVTVLPIQCLCVGGRGRRQLVGPPPLFLGTPNIYTHFLLCVFTFLPLLLSSFFSSFSSFSSISRILEINGNGPNFFFFVPAAVLDASSSSGSGSMTGAIEAVSHGRSLPIIRGRFFVF